MKLFQSVIVRYLVVGVITLGFMLWGYSIVTSSLHHAEVLPVYGPVNDDSSAHVIQKFSFTNQAGQKISQENFKGKIYVADFFFTTCKGICPIMSGQMERVYKAYLGNEKVKFLSHTVKPEEDSVPVLAEYARMHEADTHQWSFVTGDKKQIYDMARNSYMVTITEGSGGPDDFIHTQFFTLIDPESRIRGFYDGTDSTDVNKLIGDIRILLKD